MNITAENHKICDPCLVCFDGMSTNRQSKCSTMTRWNASDNAKLTALWRLPHNGVDSTKLDKDSVKAVHTKHFLHTKYANFAPLYRFKARAFNISVSLDGHQKSKSLQHVKSFGFSSHLPFGCCRKCFCKSCCCGSRFLGRNF